MRLNRVSGSINAGRLGSKSGNETMATNSPVVPSSTTPAPPTALNSFFGRPGEREAATAALRQRLAALPADAGLVLMVTHQVNITDLTGVFPASGEMVVLKRDASGAVVTVGRLPAP